MAVYQWRIPNVPVPAQEAGEYLTALEKERGSLLKTSWPFRLERGAPPAPVRAFVSVNKGDNSHSSYVSIDIAMSKEELRVQVLQDAYGELSAFQRKYSAYLELQGVFSAIDDFGKKIGR